MRNKNTMKLGKRKRGGEEMKDKQKRSGQIEKKGAQSGEK